MNDYKELPPTTPTHDSDPLALEVAHELRNEASAGRTDAPELVSSPESALTEVPAPTGFLGSPAVAQDPVRVFLASYSSPKSRSVMLQGLERIAMVTQVPVASMAWPSLTWAHTSAIHARLGERYTRNTVRVTLAALTRVLEVCCNLGLMTREAFVTATAYGKRRGSILEDPGRALTGAEVLKLVAWTRAQRGPYGAFLRALFGVALGGGLRAEELCTIEAGGFTRDATGDARVYVVGKGAKHSEVLLGGPEAREVDGWLRVRAVLEPTCSRLFVRVGKHGQLTRDEPMDHTILYRLCEEVSRSSGVAAFAPHDLRRTFATRLFEAGHSDSVVQKLMRHASADTTRRYDRRTRETIETARRGVAMWPDAPSVALTEAKADH